VRGVNGLGIDGDGVYSSKSSKLDQREWEIEIDVSVGSWSYIGMAEQYSTILDECVASFGRLATHDSTGVLDYGGAPPERGGLSVLGMIRRVWRPSFFCS
jgi:hypothetical protein